MRYFNITGLCDKVKHYATAASEKLHGVKQLTDTELLKASTACTPEGIQAVPEAEMRS
ncbi:MAG: hypothetical protein LBL57_05390 [Tannerella sp.]|jgi:hypothetical protein|nr:hypothetical protein [Tannerella sp.]